ncbi:MAG: hypothetical protein K1X55_16540 [Chitinophagales bacterium]|nr:hypothetical protein [Chitinophagales bacterium]
MIAKQNKLSDFVVPLATILIIFAPYIKIFSLEPLYWIVILLYAYYFLKAKSIHIKPVIFYAIPIVIHTACLMVKYYSFHSLGFENISDYIKNIHTFILVFIVFSYYYHKENEYLVNHLFLQFSSLNLILFLLVIIGLIQFFDIKSIENFIRSLYEITVVHKYAGEVSNFDFSDKMSRINGIFQSPLAFAAILSPLILMSLSVQKYIKTNWLVLIGCILVLFTTSARASFVTCMLGVVIIFFRNLSIGKILQLSLVFLAFYFIYSSFISTETNDTRFSELFNYVGSGFDSEFMPPTIVSRIEYMTVIYYYFIENGSFWFGMDLTAFYNEVVGYSFESQYFAWYVKYGIWGILFFLWYLALAFRMFFMLRKFKPDSFLFQIILGFTIILFTNFVVAVTQQSAHGRHIREIMFLTIGIIEVFNYKISYEYREP